MPDWRGPIRDHLRGVRLDPAREAEIVEELSAHLDDRYRELLKGGMAPDAASHEAVQELESLRVTPRPWRERLPVGSSYRGKNLMANLWHDLKVAFRLIRSKPAFSAALVFMLSVGIAGNAAIFSIFNGLFLRPLPFADPARLVDLDETAPKWNLVRVGISNPDYDAWMKGNSTFQSMAFFSTGGANLSEKDIPAQRVKTAQVTREMLTVIGLKPIIGRDFSAEEDKPNGPRVTLLGNELWQRLFHSDRNVLGRTIELSDRPYTIIGVLPPQAVVPPDVELWMPLQADTTKGGSFYLGGIGRLKRGVTLQQAEADLMRVHCARPGFEHAEAYPVLAPVRDRYLGDFKTVTRILLGAVALVLIIACVNIAGLMLVHGESRSREIAIRTAIGASRGRVIGQLLTESFVIAAIGGALGVLLGNVWLAGLVSLMPTDLPKWVRFDLDARFAFFCAAVTAGAAILFGLAPALQAARVDGRSCMQESARSTLTRRKRTVLSGLVVCEIALAVILLVSSGLLLQAFQKVRHTNLGFQPENVITWSLRLAPAKYPKPEAGYAAYHRIMERLRALPGVTAASAATVIPLNGHSGYFYEAEGGRKPGGDEKNPVVLQVTALAGYFDAMGIRVKAGRAFDERDEQPKAPKVAIVNETFAKYYWGNLNVVGKRIHYPGTPDEKNWFQVIGIVQDMRHYGLDQELRAEVLVPYPVSPANGMTIVLRSPADPRSLIGPAREIIREVDPDLPMYDIRTMDERVNRSLWTRRAYSWLFAAFATIAMLLAAAGIYGVISFAVSQRTREIGIRIALGARPSQVMRTVLANGMVLVGIGLMLGLVGAQLTGTLLKTMLFGVSARDLVTYAFVVTAIAGLGLLANYIPARRAAKVEPMRALRSE